MKDKLCIWWLDQASCEAIGEDLSSEFPLYLQSQYRSRFGRAGHARLWSGKQFGNVGIDNWPKPESYVGLADNSKRTRFARCLEREGYGGIVMYISDYLHVKNLPGIITDFDLKLFKKESNVD